MHPILLKLGPLTLHTYGVALTVALLVASWLAARRARAMPPELAAMTPAQSADFACLSLAGRIAGARLLYVLLEWDFFGRSPQEILALWHGGLVWYGGFLGGVLAGWLYARAKRLAFWRVMDHWIPFLALGHAIGRFGCFFNGCCYGRPTSAWYGVVFPGQAAPVVPTQLFEAAGLVVLYVILRLLQRPSLLSRPGGLFGVYLISYGGLRFLLEFLRGDQTPWWAGLTLQQLISVGASFAGWGLLRSAMQRRATP